MVEVVAKDVVALLIVGVPIVVGLVLFLLVCRVLWHAGSWFKRKDR